MAKVKANALSSSSIMVEWDKLSDVSSYLITYNTTTSSSNVTVKNGDTKSYTLTSLEQNTQYTITVQATTSDNRMSVKSNKVLVKTYPNGKRFIS